MKVYVEGGGDANIMRTKCRKGFTEFFRRAGLSGRMPRIVACGSRNQAYDDFCTAVRMGQEEIPILLVDSEGPILPNESPWQYLKSRDDWQCPDDVKQGQVQLMVQCMETWFLADRDVLATFYGQGFTAGALPKRLDIENVSKKDIFDGLSRATRNSQPKGEYQKKHSFDLLSMIDPDKLRKVSPHAQKLISALNSGMEDDA
ncbi:MAG: DUF4276 family protein [Nitrospira sp.]|nr:MAG: DUF4276 family protein [Nitrospira sp.]